MSDETDRYGGDEVSLILRRASELQARAPSADSLSLEELEEIAAEAGIDPRFVRQAAAGLGPKARRNFSILGAPTRFSRAVEVEGEVAPEHFDALVSLIRAELGRVGSAETIVSSLEWRDKTEFDSVGVSVTPRRGRTRIDVHTGREEEAGVIVTLTGFLGVLGAIPVLWAMAPLSLLDLLGLLGGGGAVIWGLSALWWRHFASTWRDKVDRLAGKLARAVEAVAEEASERANASGAVEGTPETE